MVTVKERIREYGKVKREQVLWKPGRQVGSSPGDLFI